MNPTAESPTSAASLATLHEGAVERFFYGLDDHNVDASAKLLADDVVQEIVLSANGSQAPSALLRRAGANKSDRVATLTSGDRP